MKVKKLFEEVLEEDELYSSETDNRERFKQLEKKYNFKASFQKNNVAYVKFSNSKEDLEDWLKKLRDSSKNLDKKTKIHIVSGVVETNKNLKESKEGEGEIPKEKEQKLIDFVKSHENLDDDDFHAYAEKLGVDPHEAEEVIYRALNVKFKKK